MRQRWREIVLLLLTVALSLAAGELALRWAFPSLQFSPTKDAYLGWSSAEYRRFSPESSPSDHRLRLLFLGDSYLAGAGLRSLDQRFPIVLAKRLADTVNVAILASTGWGTDQELMAFRQKGTRWRPDLVVLTFVATNDISNNVSHTSGTGSALKPYFVLGGDGKLQQFDGLGNRFDPSLIEVETAGPLLTSTLHRLVTIALRRVGAVIFGDDGTRTDPTKVDPRYRQFDLRSEPMAELFALKRRLSWSPQRSVNHVSAFVHEAFPLNTYQWALFEALLVELKRACRAAGARLVLMPLPVGIKPGDLRFVLGSGLRKRFETPDGAFTFYVDEPLHRLRAIAARQGVELYEPTEAFRYKVERRGVTSEVWPDPKDRHLSALGHTILADIFATYLVRRMKVQ